VYWVQQRCIGYKFCTTSMYHGTKYLYHSTNFEIWYRKRNGWPFPMRSRDQNMKAFGRVCVYYCRTYDKAVCGGGRGQWRTCANLNLWWQPPWLASERAQRSRTGYWVKWRTLFERRNLYIVVTRLLICARELLHRDYTVNLQLTSINPVNGIPVVAVLQIRY
jgi:hypothetical protein